MRIGLVALRSSSVRVLSLMVVLLFLACGREPTAPPARPCTLSKTVVSNGIMIVISAYYPTCPDTSHGY